MMLKMGEKFQIYPVPKKQSYNYKKMCQGCGNGKYQPAGRTIDFGKLLTRHKVFAFTRSFGASAVMPENVFLQNEIYIIETPSYLFYIFYGSF